VKSIEGEPPVTAGAAPGLDDRFVPAPAMVPPWVPGAVRGVPSTPTAWPLSFRAPDRPPPRRVDCRPPAAGSARCQCDPGVGLHHHMVLIPSWRPRPVFVGVASHLGSTVEITRRARTPPRDPPPPSVSSESRQADVLGRRSAPARHRIRTLRVDSSSGKGGPSSRCAVADQRHPTSSSLAAPGRPGEIRRLTRLA